MAYNLEPRTIKENLLGLIGKNPHAEPRPANTREECFLADIAENGGGTGGLPEVTSDDNGDFLGVVDGEWDKVPAPSSLPPYTSADKGKVLTVGDAEPQTVNVIPEQSGTISAITYNLESTAYGAILDGVDTSSLANGQSVTFDMAIGTQSNSVTLYYIADTNIFSSALDETGDAYVFLTEVDGQNKWIFNTYDQSTVGLAYTVSATASVPSVEPKWEEREKIVGFAIPVASTGSEGQETWFLDGVTIADVEGAFNSGKYLYFTGNFGTEWVGTPITYIIDDSDPSWHVFEGSFFTIETGGGGAITKISIDLWSDGTNYELRGAEETVWPVN